MIDWDRLNGLRDDIGEDDFADVAALFVSEIMERLSLLRADPGGAAAADFHFLRGSAANLGFAGLADACLAAEQACSSGSMPDIAAVDGIFSASLDAVAPTMPALSRAA